MPVALAGVDAEVLRLLGPAASVRLRQSVARFVASLDDADREALRRALEQVLDLEEREVRDVLGRDGEPVLVHRYRSCRSEDTETSWDWRPPSALMRRLRHALMSGLLGAEAIRVEGMERLVDAARAGNQFLFVSNHESVHDLAVLPHALRAAGLEELAGRLTFFVNPKIFNVPFDHLFICQAVGLIKVPQSPRIAANESVMAPADIQRRARHGFGVARARMAQGDSLVIYPEGLRSDGELHRFARAYLELLRPEAPGRDGAHVLLVPWAHQGVRTLEDRALTARVVTLRVGTPIDPADLFELVGTRPLGVAGHLVGYLVARLLPEVQRGLYGDAPEAYLGHPHFRRRVEPHTLADMRVARGLAGALLPD